MMKIILIFAFLLSALQFVWSDDKNCLFSINSQCTDCLKENSCAFYYCKHPTEIRQFKCMNTNKKLPNETCETANKWTKIQYKSERECPKLTYNSNANLSFEKKKKPVNELVKVLDGNCPVDSKTPCQNCTAEKSCAFWYCSTKSGSSNQTICQDVKDKKPKTDCQGHWKKVEHEHSSDCPSNSTITTTTTTTTTTPKTDTTTPKTDTTTPKTESTTSKTVPSTVDPTQGPVPTPQPKKEGHFNWILFIIVISCLAVTALIILIGVRIHRWYEERNYESLIPPPT